MKANTLRPQSIEQHDIEELIVRFLQGIASEEERHALRRWRTEAPNADANDRRFRELDRLWTLTGCVTPHAQFSSPPDPEELLASDQRREDAVQERLQVGARCA